MIDNVAVLIPLTGILAGTTFTVVVVWLILRYRALRLQMAYETAVKLAEKGQPVPPELFANLNTPRSGMRRGLVLVMFGLSLSICFYELGVPWTLGLIPLFIGAGFLIAWRLERTDERR